MNEIINEITKDPIKQSHSNALLDSVISVSQEVAYYISIIIGYVGLIVLLLGIVFAFIELLKKLSGKAIAIGQIRLNLGHYLILALELLVAKDILESIFSPSLQTLLELLLIVVIRTILTYFLNKEIAQVKADIEDELNKQR